MKGDSSGSSSSSTYLAEQYVEGALRNHYTGFANLADMMGEVHQGLSKAYPCGAGVGLLGVAPEGELGLCHRFAGAGDHDFGHVATGIDNAKRSEHLAKGHLDNRTDCHTCWAGAFVPEAATTRPRCGMEIDSSRTFTTATTSGASPS